jgi:hypothetical protein
VGTTSASPFRDAGRLTDEAAGARITQLFGDHAWHETERAEAEPDVRLGETSR